jgi:hypothetical protein
MISQRNSGSTAAPLGYPYQLASDAIARRMLSLGPYDRGAGTLHFRAAPRGPRQQGAELISQPLQYVVKGQAWWFSIWINISLHTVPFDPRPRLHLHTGVRRWATRVDPRTGQLSLPYTRDTSVYLSPTVPWLHCTPVPRRCTSSRHNCRSCLPCPFVAPAGESSGDIGRVPCGARGPPNRCSRPGWRPGPAVP